MRITIIPEDGTVYENDVSYNGLDLSSANIPVDVHALQWRDVAGWIEFKDARPNQEITELPSWVSPCLTAWEQADYAAKHPPAPTPEQLLFAVQQQALGLLFESDFSQLKDINLTNYSDWVTYRDQVRAIHANPTLDPVWPTKPPTIWG